MNLGRKPAKTAFADHVVACFACVRLTFAGRSVLPRLMHLTSGPIATRELNERIRSAPQRTIAQCPDVGEAIHFVGVICLRVEAALAANLSMNASKAA